MRESTKLLLATLALLCSGSLVSMAAWTDSAVVTSGTITAGSMDLQVNSGAVGQGTAYSATDITVSDLTPGEAQAYPLTLKNVGKPNFTWTASTQQASGWTFVGSPISVRLYAGSPVDDSTYPRVDSCNGTALGNAVTVASTAAGVVTTPPTIAAGASSTLCVLVSMATTASNDNQGKSGKVQFNVTANQVTS